MAIRKKGSIKSTPKKLKTKNLWKCEKCNTSLTKDHTQDGLQPSPKCEKCGEGMVLIGLGASE